MYTEGMGYSAISRVLGVKPETIYSWVKKLFNLWLRWKRSARLQRQVGVKVISLDEMWTYAGARLGAARNSRRIWTAAMEDAPGNRCNDFDMVGDRSEVRLLAHVGADSGHDALQERHIRGVWLSAMNKHRIGKGGAVNMNDGLHSELRGKLNRLVRRIKGYSKTDGMLILSLALAWLKLGWI